MDVVPDKMPNDIPYGTPISLGQAQAAINAAVAESNKRGWKVNVAVVDSGANLVAFARMDGAQLGSIAISEHKARASAKFRRETKAFEAGIQAGNNYLLTLDDVIGSRGGILLMDSGRIVGAIGRPGGTRSPGGSGGPARRHRGEAQAAFPGGAQKGPERRAHIGRKNLRNAV